MRERGGLLWDITLKPYEIVGGREEEETEKEKKQRIEA